MAFIQPCFIKKNTTELRKKLEELGYNRYPLWMADWSDDDSRYKYLVTDVLYYTYPQEPSKPKRGEHINCGTNEELFLALAALRDDSDYMQWFISDETKQFYKCTSNKFDFHQEGIANWICCSSAEYFRKATVEEIIEHFKK